MNVSFEDLELNPTDEEIVKELQDKPQTSWRLHRNTDRCWTYICQRLRGLKERGLVKKKNKRWHSRVIYEEDSNEN